MKRSAATVPFGLLAVALLLILAGALDAEAQDAVPVAPMEDWLRFDEIVHDAQPISLHLRTGFERPLIFPEPVRIQGRPSLPGCDVEIDIDVAMFSPGVQFTTERIDFIGTQSGTVYHVDVRSDALGSRVPVRLSLQ